MHACLASRTVLCSSPFPSQSRPPKPWRRCGASKCEIEISQISVINLYRWKLHETKPVDDRDGGIRSTVGQIRMITHLSLACSCVLLFCVLVTAPISLDMDLLPTGRGRYDS